LYWFGYSEQLYVGTVIKKPRWLVEAKRKFHFESVRVGKLIALIECQLPQHGK